MIDERRINARMISLLASKLTTVGQQAFLDVLVRELAPLEQDRQVVLKNARAQAEGEMGVALKFERVRK